MSSAPCIGWAQPGVPHKGWRYMEVLDLEEAIHTCQMCGREEIRYVHVLEHSSYPRSIEVGCVCAEKLTEDYRGPRERERHLRSRARRRVAWIRRRGWRLSRSGNYVIAVEGWRITVYYKELGGAGGWSYIASCEGRGEKRWGSGRYTTPVEAQLAVFDALWPPRSIVRRVSSVAPRTTTNS